MLNPIIKSFLRVILLLAIVFVILVLSLFGYLYKLSHHPPKADVPLVGGVTKIEGNPTSDDAYIPITITDPEKIHLIEDFINQFQQKWYAPFPKASMGSFQLALYQNNRPAYGFSMYKNSMSFGLSAECDVPEEKMEPFIREAFPQYHEAMFPIVPAGTATPEILVSWKEKLAGLTGVSAEKLNEFLIENDIPVTMVYLSSFSLANGTPGGGFMLVNLKMVNEGKYVDTVIKGLIDLNHDKSVAKTRFDGIGTSKKVPQEKTLAYWHKKLAELPPGTPFDAVKEFIARNNIAVLQQNADGVLLKLAFVQDTWVREPEPAAPGDAIISAKLSWDEDGNLLKATLLGYQEVKKSESANRMLYPPTLKHPHQEFNEAPNADFMLTGVKLSKNPVNPGDDVNLDVSYQYAGAAGTYPSFAVLVTVNGKTLENWQFGNSSYPKACEPGYSCTGTISFGEGGGSDDFNQEFYKLAQKGDNELKVTLDPANVIPEKNKTNNELTTTFVMN